MKSPRLHSPEKLHSISQYNFPKNPKITRYKGDLLGRLTNLAINTACSAVGFRLIAFVVSRHWGDHIKRWLCGCQIWMLETKLLHTDKVNQALSVSASRSQGNLLRICPIALPIIPGIGFQCPAAFIIFLEGPQSTAY